MTIVFDKEDLKEVKNKQEVVDSMKVREICNEIIKFGVNQNQIVKIIKILSLELEDRQMMIRIADAIDNNNLVDKKIKTNFEM